MGILITFLKIIVVLGFLIFIHEAGHFVVAKMCNVKVKEFSIGFGPVLFKKKGKETIYTLRAIPLGGFNDLEGETGKSDSERAFCNVSVYKRMAIIIAGGLVNIVFGLVVYFILVSCVGNFETTIVSNLEEGYGASKAGIQVGDEIISINNKKVNLRQDIDKIFTNQNIPEKIPVVVKRNNEKLEFDVTLKVETKKDFGMYFGAVSSSTEMSAEIKMLDKNEPAELAGMQVGDIILKVDGIETENDGYKASDLLKYSENEEVEITYQRNNDIYTVKLIPGERYEYYLGTYFKIAENNFLNNVYYGFLDTGYFWNSIFESVAELFKGNVNAQQLMGPIGISEVVAETKYIEEFIYFAALISISLGVTNLLPVPALDGGKLVFLIIEAIRKKPLNENIELYIQSAGFLLLILLSIYIAINDVIRLF